MKPLSLPIVFLGVAAVLLAGCTNNDQVTGSLRTKPHTDITAKYENVILDTLTVYSPEQDSGSEYSGVALDSVEAKRFPREIVDAYNLDKSGLYAVYKFQQNAGVTALITRSPAMYWPSSIKIFFYHKQQDSIGGFVELAENWGDAGDSYTKKSWLYNDHGRLHAFVWDQESHDHSVDDEHDTTIEQYNHYYVLDLSQCRADTVARDTVVFSRLFKRLHTRTK